MTQSPREFDAGGVFIQGEFMHNRDIVKSGEIR